VAALFFCCTIVDPNRSVLVFGFTVHAPISPHGPVGGGWAAR